MKQYDGGTYHNDGATLDDTSKYSKNQIEYLSSILELKYLCSEIRVPVT